MEIGFREINLSEATTVVNAVTISSVMLARICICQMTFTELGQSSFVLLSSPPPPHSLSHFNIKNKNFTPTPAPQIMYFSLEP